MFISSSIIVEIPMLNDFFFFLAKYIDTMTPEYRTLMWEAQGVISKL